MADGLEVITAGLFNSLMSSDRGVSSSTSQVLTIFIGDVLSLRILKTLSQTEVNDVDCVLGVLRASDEEVIWLDITVNNPLFMHFLDTVDHLSSDHQTSFQIKLPAACLEQVL